MPLSLFFSAYSASGMHRGLDGKKFKLFSIKKMDMDFLRHPQYIQAIRKNKALHFRFPPPLGVAAGSGSAAVITLDDCSIAWRTATSAATSAATAAGGGDGKGSPPALSHVSLAVGLTSRIAIVGPNGQGGGY